MDKNIQEITTKQWFLLGTLTYFENPPTLKELSKELGYSHQNTKQLLNKLKEKGFVTFQRDLEDRRSIRIHITKKVREWGEKNEENSKLFVDLLFSGISQDKLDIVLDVLNRFHERLERYNEET